MPPSSRGIRISSPPPTPAFALLLAIPHLPPSPRRSELCFGSFLLAYFTDGYENIWRTLQALPTDTAQYSYTSC
ncbi:hypothetical protein BV20DRAFT_971882 [Pilatotrama ljubarskyi]|nr:hypothetical protein BV20DRAFT_971882 [Pilatotrama ljubarskyi]